MNNNTYLTKFKDSIKKALELREIELRKIAEAKLQDTNRTEFKCPYCGGTVKASKAKINGHIWLECDTCGLNLRE